MTERTRREGNLVDDGPVSRHSTIPLSSVDLTEVETAYVQAALSNGWISGTGPFVSRFEEALGKRIDRAYTIAVANGTLGLELALRALGVGPGDEVIVPALTFAAPAMSVCAVGASVVFADITAETWTLSPAEVEARRTDRTKAIIAVDALGHPADYDLLAGFGVPIIADAAEAHGSMYKGQPAGSLGDVAVFSFHANKTITTGEGGAVCTDDRELDQLMRTMANHGMRPDRPYVHEMLGRNYRMTNLTAAIGLGQVERWDELIDARGRVYDRYTELIPADVARPRPVADWADYVCWLHTVTVADRAAVLDRLRAGGVDARGIWPALPDQPVFADIAGVAEGFAVARRISHSAIWLPTFPQLTDEQIGLVAELVCAG
jgi:perosamine synthetase